MIIFLGLGLDAVDGHISWVRSGYSNRSRWLSGRASASGSGCHGFEPRPRHTKGIKNGTSGYLAWCSAL